MRLSRRLARAQSITRADLFDAPAEQVIAQWRVIVCAVSLLAVYIDPTHPIHHGTPMMVVLIAYSLLAVALMTVPVSKVPGRAVGYLVHIGDMTFLATLFFMSNGRANPFFAFFSFVVLLVASLRWNWLQVLGTAAVLVVVIWVTGDPRAAVPSPLDGYNFNSVIMRGIYLTLAALMIAYFSALRERRLAQLAKLTDWPGPDPSQTDVPGVAKLLEHCANALEVPRVLVLWEELEEPFVHVALWQAGGYTQTREMAGAFGKFVRSGRYANSAFWTDDVASRFAVMRDSPRYLTEPIIDQGLASAFQIGSVGTAPFAGALCKGRVFILDRESWSDFQLLLTEILASRIANALDRQILQVQAKEAAAVRERARLTRDLHDGTLQSLTAAGLQLKLMGDGGDLSRLDAIKELLKNEQRRIREFVDRTPVAADAGLGVALDATLARSLSETARNWGCKTSLAVQPPEAKIPATLGVQLSLILAEAVANAVRHGRASEVHVSANQTSDDLHIHIRDNGIGFAEIGAENGKTFGIPHRPIFAARARK